MNKNLITALSIVCILFFSCSKSKQPGPQNTGTSAIKITLVSGSGQTDTVGQTLLSPIVVKVTQNGAPVSGYTVQFTGSGCNSDRVDLASSKSDGTISYNWSLAGDLGPQTLKAYALNSQNIKVDSVTATSTGIVGGLGWEISACSIQGGYIASSFCKLSTGRLFVCYSGIELRYSDDNGVSWNLVSSLGKSHSLQFVVASPTDEIFAFSGADGIYASSDAGATWTVASTPAFEVTTLLSAVCTPTGKLMATDETTVHVSLDKGKTWTTPAASFGDKQMNSPAEDKSGNLYVVGEETQTIYKSTDNGATWNAIPHPGEFDFALYIDNNNTFYKSTSTGGIYISKDSGATYTLLVKAPNEFIENMSVQSDGNFYYDMINKGLYMLKGTVSTHLDDNESSEPTAYVLAPNNNIVFCDFTGYINHYRL